MFDKETTTDAPPSHLPPTEVEIVGGGLEASVRELSGLVRSVEPKLGAVRDSLSAVVEASRALGEVAAAWTVSQRASETQLRELAQAMGDVLRGIEKRLDAMASEIHRLSSALL